MPDGADAPAYTFTDRGLIIVPGLGYDECENLWQTACAVHRQSLFSLGDAGNYAFETLGETAAQFVSDYAPETVRVAMWVCRKIEYSRRRPALSFSLHRELAGVDPADQDDLLGKAETLGWRTADMKAAVKERKEAARSRYPRNGAPAETDDHDDDRQGEDATETPRGGAECAGAGAAPDHAAEAVLALPARAAVLDLVAHLRRQREWSERTFGPGDRSKGVIDHIRKELREIEAEPASLEEWIDVVILALDGAWRAGHDPEAIVAALIAKQTKNEGRQWPDWRTRPIDKAIEHVRGG